MNLDYLRAEIAALIAGTHFAGKTYLAGGCVRDYVAVTQFGRDLINEISDIDITVEMVNGGILLADYLSTQMEHESYQTFPVFCTAKLDCGNLCIEFVATRKEEYRANNRYPAVSHGTLLDDVIRRDFSINTLLMDIVSGKILDLTGMGVHDLQHGIIRCVGEPVHKFREDPLRLLRALRLALCFGYSYEPDTYEAMLSEGKEINRLTLKSIKNELSKVVRQNSKQNLRSAVAALGWDMPKLTKLLQST